MLTPTPRLVFIPPTGWAAVSRSLLLRAKWPQPVRAVTCTGSWHKVTVGIINNAVKSFLPCQLCAERLIVALIGQCMYPGLHCHDPRWYGLTLRFQPLHDGLSSLSAVQGETGSCDRSLAFNISWYLRSSVCYNEVFNTPVSIGSSPRMSGSSLHVLPRLLIFSTFFFLSFSNNKPSEQLPCPP